MAQGGIKCTPKPVYDILFLRRLHWNCSGFWIRLHIYTWTKIDGKTYQPRGLLACFSLQHALMYEPSLHRYQISDISPNSQWNSLIAIKLRFCYVWHCLNVLKILRCEKHRLYCLFLTSVIGSIFKYQVNAEKCISYWIPSRYYLTYYIHVWKLVYCPWQQLEMNSSQF